MTAATEKVDYLKQRLAAFMDYLDQIDPEETSLKEVDDMINMLEDLEHSIK